MCGFVGFTNHIDNSNVVLGEMLDKIKHRGPDAEGTYIDEDIALGHRRLSIIDVSGCRHTAAVQRGRQSGAAVQRRDL